jgi:SAM-dependent methyltransferase
MASGAVGTVTRGTTNTNRLRRVDRWIASLPLLRRTPDPLVVDLGYGASGVTALELQQRLAKARADVEVVGLEIEPGRVRTAEEQLAEVRAGRTSFDPAARIRFAVGGFEVPLPEGRRAAVIRAFNVLRQYDESEVAAAWDRMLARLQPDGLLVEGTCDEIGRISSWIALGSEGPRSFTVSLRLTGLEAPSIVAERLPKALIHRNIPGERVHAFLSDLDRLWRIHSPLAAYGPRQRWIAAAQGMREAGWPVIGGRSRWRLGELTVAWEAVDPVTPPPATATAATGSTGRR